MKNCVFHCFKNDFRGLENIKIDEKSEKMEPGAFRNIPKSTGIAKIGWIGQQVVAQMENWGGGGSLNALFK